MAWTAPRTWVTGEVVTAAIMNTHVRDNLKAITDPWTAYTPVWTASTTNPVLGNGTLTGAYTQIGKTIHFRITLTFGSTTTGGTGTYLWTVPVPALVAGLIVGGAYVRDVSAAGNQNRMALLANTGQVDLFDQAGTVVTNATIAWAVSDVINIVGTYEAA